MTYDMDEKKCNIPGVNFQGRGYYIGKGQYSGGVILVDNFLRGNCPGCNLLGRNFPEGNFADTDQ